ncbi:ATP-binding protein [Blastococcus sp. KM273128]|uniref:ATP-binding protein n=1 Tax=Blastococcus sp. KM273128 TaxID=2570314 RepID=UPI001F22B27D|nr:ATP-binding protein [Blastococcus sp. KM273128]MCF6743670.1 ATP-binding protein [Blastococcus sp. KM273128]
MGIWQAARPPRPFPEVWCQELTSLAELAALRARLRRSTTGSRTVAEPERDHWSERLVLIADELTSNALRHGGAPVAAVLGRDGDRWLIAVRDAAVDVPPAPAEGRDPGLGGFGLYLVADLSAAHGWFTEPGAKTAWAVVDGGA